MTDFPLVAFGPLSTDTPLSDGAVMARAYALNQHYQALLSPLDEEAFASLVAGASYAKHAGDGDAFLIAYDQSAAYDSPHFERFKKKLDRFYYIDRIAIAPSLQGAGLARRFYQDLEDLARVQGAGHLCAEVNIEPPNPASHAFHQSFGFVEDGQITVETSYGVVKTLQYYIKAL